MVSQHLQYDDEHRPKRFVQMTANPVAKKQDLTMDINMPFGPLSDEQEDDYEMPMKQNKKKKKALKARPSTFLSAPQMVQSQIASIALTEKVLKELKQEKAEKSNILEGNLRRLETTEEQIKAFES
jgi:hypothetical protein